MALWKTGGYPVGKHQKAATVMADSIEAGRWVHTFGCGHATIPVEEMYPRIGSFVGFHHLRIASDILHADYRPDGYSSVPLPGTGRRLRPRNHEEL